MEWLDTMLIGGRKTTNQVLAKPRFFHLLNTYRCPHLHLSPTEWYTENMLTSGLTTSILPFGSIDYPLSSIFKDFEAV